MAKTVSEQWSEALWNAQRPLIVLPPHVDTDIFAAACALGHALQTTHRHITILCPRTMSSHADFLIKNLFIVSSLEETRTYQCTIPEHLHIETVSHEISREGGGVITVTFAQKPQENPPALSITPTLPKFDRIIVLGAQDLGDIAPLFGDIHALLTHVPLATVSWQTVNEAFGHWNIHVGQAETCCESIAYLLQETAPLSIKDHVATCLLGGIIAKTKHFRAEFVTPGMLNLAADLVAAGADRLKIIEVLYRTRSLDLLRLWGIACARLQEITPGILASELTEDDFLATHSSPKVLPEIAQEVLQSNATAEEIIFFSKKSGVLHATVVAKKNHDARTFLGALRTEGTKETAYHTFAPETQVLDVLTHIRTLKNRA